MDSQAEEGAAGAQGVMVIRAWNQGVSGGLLARVTFAVDDMAEVTRSVASPGELHSVLEEWLSILRH